MALNNQRQFNQQHYDYYQKCAADYKSRQEKLRQDGMYILTIKNHRQYMNSSKTAAEHISEFTNIDLSQDPNVIVDARARHNNADMRDFTILFLFKLTNAEMAQRIMAQRVDKLKQIGSFNVQLAFEDRMAEKKLKKLKASGVIAGYGQNRYGMMYVALDKLPEQCEDQNIYPTGTNADKQYILLNSPPVDSELTDAHSFRMLAKPVDSVYCFKNHMTNKFEVVEKPAHRDNMENWVIQPNDGSITANHPIKVQNNGNPYGGQNVWGEPQRKVGPPPGIGEYDSRHHQRHDTTGSHIWGNPTKSNNVHQNNVYQSHQQMNQHHQRSQYPQGQYGYPQYGYQQSGYQQAGYHEAPSSQWDSHSGQYYQYQNQYDPSSVFHPNSGNIGGNIGGNQYTQVTNTFDNNDREVQRITDKNQRNSDGQIGDKNVQIFEPKMDMSKSMGATGLNQSIGNNNQNSHFGHQNLSQNSNRGSFASNQISNQASNQASNQSSNHASNQAFNQGSNQIQSNNHQSHVQTNQMTSNQSVVSQMSTSQITSSQNISPGQQIHSNQSEPNLLDTLLPTKDNDSNSTGSQIRSPVFESSGVQSEILAGMGSLSVSDYNRNSPYNRKMTESKSSGITDLWGSTNNKSTWDVGNPLGSIGTPNNSQSGLLNGLSNNSQKGQSTGLNSLVNDNSSNQHAINGHSTNGHTNNHSATNGIQVTPGSKNQKSTVDCVGKFVEYMQSKYNMKVIRSFPDKNELYRALSDQIYNDQTRFSTLRNEVVEHMRKQGKFNDYIQTADELEALSDLLSRKIEIFEVDVAMQNSESAQLPTPRVVSAPSLLFNDTGVQAPLRISRHENGCYCSIRSNQ